MATTKHNMAGKVDEFIKVAEKALFEAKRAHDRLDKEPPRGEKGEYGARGITGENGKDGRDGVDGKQGLSITGPPGPAGTRGERGADGKDSPQREEFTALLEEVRRELRLIRQEFEQLRADQDLLSRAFTSSSQKSSDYLKFLQSKVDAAIKAHQQ
jgi:hypothetical protein